MGIRKKGLWGVALALGLVTPSISSAIVIDDFDNGAVSMTRSAVGTSTSHQTGSLSHMLGGHRDIKLSVTSVLIPLTSSDIEVATSFGLLSFSNDAKVKGKMEVLWDANGSGLGGLDLTDGGLDDKLKVEYLFSDLGSSLTFVVTDMLNNSSKMTLATLSGASVQQFPFIDFTPVAATSADFTNVKAVKLTLDAPTSGDYIIDLIATASPNPEPTTATLGLMGLLATALVGHRRRTA